jgi:hypothetical protein
VSIVGMPLSYTVFFSSSMPTRAHTQHATQTTHAVALGVAQFMSDAPLFFGITWLDLRHPLLL